MASLAAIVAAAPAQAGHYFGTYTTDDGAPLAASFSLTTSDTVNAAGGLDILSLGGNVEGDAITGLVFDFDPGKPGQLTTSVGTFTYDNTLFTIPQFLDGEGILFTTASGAMYNIFFDASGRYRLYQDRRHYSYGAFALASAGVPETATWLMMVAGFGLVGGALRSRGKASIAFA
jgi:hypothetical protein